MNKRIVIVEDEPITRMDISEMLKAEGYKVVGEASDGLDAIQLCRELKPDAVIMDIKMPILNGLKSSKILIEENISDCIILLTAYSTKELIDQAKEIGVTGYVIKPVNEKSLIPAIEIGLSKAEEVRAAKEEAIRSKKKLEARKLIDIAKGLLIEREGLNESTAYEKIRKISMNRRISMEEVAKVIILNYEGDY